MAFDEATKLALQMGSATADAISFMADLSEELPVISPVLKTLAAAREMVKTINSNRGALEELNERCTYLTACVIHRCRQNPASGMDVSPLADCVDEFGRFVQRCNRRGRVSRVLKASRDREEIARLNGRVDELSRDLILAGVASVAMHLATRQEQLLESRPAQPKLAKIPKGTPAQKSWHVHRRQVDEVVFEALTGDGAPRLVGLVGDSGAGKTTAASALVRSTRLREAFFDGVLWLSVNAGAKERLPSLMLQLARMEYELVEGSVGQPPRASDDVAAYIRYRMEGAHGGRARKCLVVADNVWEKEVVSKLVETGMWVLLSTRDETLVTTTPGGRVVGVDELSKAEAESVLRGAAELSPEVRLPNEAVDLIDLCDRVAMDLAFVGRWSSVRNRQDRVAWSDATAKVRKEMKKLDDAGKAAPGGTSSRRRKAILRAGFEDLAIGSDDERVPRLYLSLTVMPDGHAFTVRDAAIMLYDRAPSAEDEASVAIVIETLERWTVVHSTEGAYRMHDAHASFGRESLMDHGKIRRSALERWVGAISSLEAVRSTDPFLLKGRWHAVETVGGDDWRKIRPYAAALAEMGDRDPHLRETIKAVARFQAAQEDWQAAHSSWRRLLEVEEKELGAAHPCVLNTLRSLADCAGRLGNTSEAAEWYARERDALPSALAEIQSHCGDDHRGRDFEREGSDEAGSLASVASSMLAWAPDKQAQAEELLRRSLEIQETRMGGDGLEVAHTLQKLSACVRQAGRHGEAEELLRRCLEIREAKLGQEDVGVAYTLYDLGTAAREAGRLHEAEQLLRRCLRIREMKLGRGDMHVGPTCYNLGECLLQAGRPEEAEGMFRRCLEIQETCLGGEHEQVAGTLHKLAACAQEAGRPDEAQLLFGRCLAIMGVKQNGGDLPSDLRGDKVYLQQAASNTAPVGPLWWNREPRTECVVQKRQTPTDRKGEESQRDGMGSNSRTRREDK
eukprot:g16862.t1